MSTLSAPAAETDVGNEHPLDKAVWNALTGRQQRFAVRNDRAVRLLASVGPFAALADLSEASFDALRPLIAEQGPATLNTLNEVTLPSGFSITRKASLLQMVWEREPEQIAWEHVKLVERDVPDMLALTAATQPGPFGPRTIELGDYIGVRKQGKLAAMAGERMKLDGFTEISAVCVDPAFRGQGHAVGLMRLLIASICARGETPFLHVIGSNEGAIAIYQRMGFVVRRQFHLTTVDAPKV